MKDDLSSQFLTFLRALLKKGCMPLVYIIPPRDKTDYRLATEPFRSLHPEGAHHRTLGGVVEHYYQLGGGEKGVGIDAPSPQTNHSM